MATLLLEIVTPERVAYSDQVDMILAPSASGIIGVLPHHMPLFTKLVEGEIKITKNKEEIFLAIGGGFMEITDQKVIVLVTDAVHAHEINEKEVLDAKIRAEEALKAKPTGAELAAAQSLFRRSTVELNLLKRKKRSSLTS